jgi:hypothetical protein
MTHPNTRKEAKEIGAKYYETGLPCKHGHVAKRSVVDGVCVECKSNYKRSDKGKSAEDKYRRRHRTKISAKNKEYRHRVDWYANNRESIIERVKEWNKNNKKRKIQSSLEWRKNHPDKAYQATLRWLKNNPHKSALYRTQRRSRIQQAKVAWANEDVIKTLYEEARRLTEESGIPHEVDHIVPLNSKTVCGLHCEDNLQILTKAQNLSKGNKHK